MMQLASRLGAPVLAIDYPLVPVSSWKDQVAAALAALRWMAAWSGARTAPGICRPSACKAAVAAAVQRGAALADSAPSMATLVKWRGAGGSNASFPHMLMGGEAAGHCTAFWACIPFPTCLLPSSSSPHTRCLHPHPCLSAGDSAGGHIMLMALSALTAPGFPGSAPGAVGLVQLRRPLRLWGR